MNGGAHSEATGITDMLRITIATALLLALGIACVSPEPVRTAQALHPVYRGQRHEQLRPPNSATLAPIRPSTTGRRHGGSWFPRGRQISPRWTHIVLHHSATPSGGAKRFDKYHRENNGWNELGYHFVIGNGTDTPDGSVEVGPRWNKQKHGAHCKTANNYFNEHGIGICLVGDFTRSKPTRKQLASLERLVRFLTVQCAIPKHKVTTHGALKPKTQCPGRHFSLLALRRALANSRSAASGR